jgi:cytoskeletal protein CcmA (bactofilin family)
MTTAEALPLLGFVTLGLREPCFLLPIFGDIDRPCIQQADTQGRIVGFAPCDLTPTTKVIFANDPSHSCQIGEPMLFAFQLIGKTVKGPKPFIQKELQRHIASLEKYPMLKAEVLDFMNDAEQVSERNRVAFRPLESPTFSTVVINIGRSVFIKGELTADEDLTIEGRVEGKIELKDHNLVIGPNGKINAEINAKNATIIGSVVGNINASDILEIKTSGSVMGDIKAPRISIADGAHFKGSVEMGRSAETRRDLGKPRRDVDLANPDSLNASLPKAQAQ